MVHTGGSKTHGYGGAAPSSEEEFKQMIIENNKESFLNDLANFVQNEIWDNKHDSYPKNYSTSISRKKALKKAEEILEGKKKTDIPPKINFDNEEHISILKKAEREGYLEKFRLGLPWHVKPFIHGEFVSFPYQHDYAILYTGINDLIFAERENTPDNLSDQKSVLKKDILWAERTSRAQ